MVTVVGGSDRCHHARQDGFKLQIKRSPAAAVRSALEASGLERVLPFIDEDG